MVKKVSNLLFFTLILNFISVVLTLNQVEINDGDDDINSRSTGSLVNLSFEGLKPLVNGVNPINSWSKVEESQQFLNKRADATIASITPYPPSTFININNLTTLSMLSAATVERMGTWYQDGLYEWTPWWQNPVAGIALAGLDNAFGNQANKKLIEDLLSLNKGDVDYMIDKYVDDQSWWAMYLLRAYQTYGNDTWLQSAKFISSNNSIWWTDQCSGGILWLTYVPNVKNTITNGLYFSILARLYRYTGEEQYFEYAMNTLNWWLSWGFEGSTGRVYDTITYPACTASGLQSYTYNSGAMLFGLVDMYYASGNTTLLDLARSISYAAMRDFTTPGSGILRERCEHDPAPTPLLPPGCQQDEIVFKGVLTLAMAELYIARPDQNIYNFINTQLLSSTFNNVDETFLFGEWWEGPWNITTAGPKTQINALCLLAAAAQINAAFLAQVNGTTKAH